MVLSRITLLLLMCLLPKTAFAQEASKQSQPMDKNVSASLQRGELYRRFLKYCTIDQAEAAKAAILYVKLFSADHDEVVKYLQNFLVKYGADGFRVTLIACGPGISRTTYEVAGGGRSLIHTVRSFDTPEQAAAAFAESIKSGLAVGERRPMFDAAGKQVGERMMVQGERRVRFLKLEGKALISIEAGTVEVIERFEASGR